MTDNIYFYINLAKECYHKYAEVTDFKNFRGEPMPAFDSLPDKIKEAWIAASRYAYDLGYRDAFK